MANKPPMIRGPDIYIGGKSKSKKKSSWEAKELSDINRYWRRPEMSREGKRQSAIHRTKGASRPQQRRSEKT